jgi:NTP pyrophosphatase (non-canonical NTP hydrolase)
MDTGDYQRKAISTAVFGDSVDDFVEEATDNEVANLLRLSYLTLKLNGEAGEIAEEVGKSLRDDDGELTFERRLKLVKELGDVQWYVAVLANELGYGLSEIMQKNLDKLAQRKEEGKLHGSGSGR